MPYPSERMASVTEVRMPGQKIDVRIAICAALDEGGNVELVKVPGGERYHGYFRQARGAYEEPWPDAVVFDWNSGIKALVAEIHRAVKAEIAK